MTTEIGGDVEPFGVVTDGAVAVVRIFGAERALAVDHDQGDFDVVFFGAAVQGVDVTERRHVEHAVDELEGVEAESFAREFKKIELGLALGEDGLVERPAGQGDFEPPCGRLGHEGRDSNTESGQGGAGAAEKIAAIGSAWRRSRAGGRGRDFPQGFQTPRATAGMNSSRPSGGKSTVRRSMALL